MKDIDSIESNIVTLIKNGSLAPQKKYCTLPNGNYTKTPQPIDR